MVIKICKTKEDVGEAAAALYNAQVIKNPKSVLGLATGSSVLTTYKAMIDANNAKITDYSQVTTFNLDEYCGLDASHSQSYRYFMSENLFKHININIKNTHVPNGNAENLEAECVDYDVAITEAGGIDIQLLGLGHNGHIAFNEPCDCFLNATHKVELTQSTIDANARFFTNANEVPRAALTMGIGTIMRAHSIVMVVSGKDKAQAVCAMVKGPITPNCPASILQFHKNVTIIVDEAGASLI